MPSQTPQSDLFAAPSPVRSLFFALLPDADTRARIEAAARATVASARMTAPHRLHVTLLYLGESAGANPRWIAAARRAADAVAVSAFEATFDRVASFRGAPPPCVLLGDDASNAPLHAFRAALHAAALAQGLREAGRTAFVPHVTLARPQQALPEAVAVQPIHWPVRAFSLLHSVRGQSDYERLGTWPLG
ncbi:2'-5' RNA ligase family protein [Luteimonas sp. FCS-9]|uniref:2'-5' RNA ligase family protein n=1 Tax=Luteimonas sp. FCS-9 TaxID=1547516 RepID=UPI00063EBF5C|nr:2'-5' RNA ligase family protein [Luteimonas sp. FCS-9]KLJ01976.1 hypothetical protein WQ56_03750 [Luteimonas sp. FCS-9]